MKYALSALVLLAGVANAAPKHEPSHYSGPPAYTSTASVSHTSTASASGSSASSSGSSSSGKPTVTIKNGTIVGTHQSTYNQDYFLGVPYAQPPTGENRFRVTQSLNTTYASTLQATSYAPSCVGYGGDDINYPVSEDCLYLNVIRPSGYENESLPIGLWIHGGGFVMGGSADKRYNLSFIVENSVALGKPFIGVSINYRLQAWGFLASQEIVGSGNTNVALRDQRLALHWVQENIAAFGGDASKVTIWGESAGAASVGFQLTAYNGRDDKLFRGAIMESGNPVSYASMRTVQQYQPIYDSIVANASCSNATDTLDCLRHVPYATLNGILNSTGSAAAAFAAPIIDGDILARWGSVQLADGAFVKVPIIDGANTDEGLSFGPSGIYNDSDFAAYITSPASPDYLPAHFVPEVLAAYPNVCADLIPPPEEIPCDYVYPSEGAEYRRSAAYAGDAVFIANRRGTVETWSAHNVSAYSYRFNTQPAGVTGVQHFQEVAFVFDNINGYGYDAAHSSTPPFQNQSQLYINLAKHMSNSWASFISELNPNYSIGRPNGTVDWPVYSAGAENIVFSGNLTTIAYTEPDTFRAEGIRFILDHALAYHR